ncbi:MAG: TolC family protein [Planctomycetales bacterium]|nr:TolC family protein [Planctomycetales bacterium]
MLARMRMFALTLVSLCAIVALAADGPRRPIRPTFASSNQRNLPTNVATSKPAGAGLNAPAPSHRVVAVTTLAPLPQPLSPSGGEGSPRVKSSIRLAAAEIEDTPPQGVEPHPMPSPAGELTAELAAYPIDLGTALQLADAQNPQVAFVRERVWQAIAQQQAADATWIPNLRAGVSYAEHDGTLQDSAGKVIDTHRYSVQSGAGAAAFGAGPPMLPGLAADFHLADALFQPLAARRATEARRAASAAATNDLLLDVARAYLDLLRTSAEVTIAADLQRHTRDLSGLTDAYATTGAGLQADADRLHTETTLRHNEFVRAEEAIWIASSRLVRLLHLDQSTILQPVGFELVPLELISPDTRLADSLETARTSRPEVIENQNLLGEAHARAQREKYSPLMPTLSLGMSYGNFGGGGGGSGSSFGDRADFQGLAYWQLRNLGLGDQAAKRERLSQVRQVWNRQEAIADQVSQEVSEAYAQWRSRSKQIEPAARGVRSAQSSYDLNLKRIQGGQGLPIEVLQSIQALAQARREYARAVSEFNTAQFALHRATGVCLSNLPVTTPVAVPAPGGPAAIK